jgi:hypothetical protein
MWGKGPEHPTRLEMDLCRDDVLGLALGIAWIELGTNLEGIPHGIHVLIHQRGPLYEAGGVLNIPQSGAQAGTSWSKSSNLVNNESIQIAQAALSARRRPITLKSESATTTKLIQKRYRV